MEVKPINTKLIAGPTTEDAYIAAWDLYINENRENYLLYIDLCGKSEDFNGEGLEMEGMLVDDWFTTTYGGQYDSSKRPAKLTWTPAPKKMTDGKRASFLPVRLCDDVNKLAKNKVKAFKGIVSVCLQGYS